MDSSSVVDELVVLLKSMEGCSLVAYPDPKWRNVPRIAGDTKWGTPWTIGYGETKGIKEGDVWTQEYADEVVRRRATYFLLNVLKICPQLLLEPHGRSVACTSLAYNIGLGAFSASSICRRTTDKLYEIAAKAFLLWNKAGGRVMRGLTIRRRIEKRIYECVN